MVSLGYVKDAAQSPQGTPRVYLRRHTSPGPVVRAWSGKRRSSGMELRWGIPSGNVDDWAGSMAAAVTDLGWRSWWLDSESVANALGGTTQETLTRWGLAFWGQYRKVGSVYLMVGENSRSKVSAAVKVWEQAFSHVRYVERLDIDRQMRQKAEELQNKPVRRTLAKFFPALFKSL